MLNLPSQKKTKKAIFETVTKQLDFKLPDETTEEDLIAKEFRKNCSCYLNQTMVSQSLAFK